MKEFSSYNSLGQSQFPQYYAPAPTYVPAGLPNNDGHGANVGVAGYPAIKTEGSASAGLPSTTGTASTCHHLDLLTSTHHNLNQKGVLIAMKVCTDRGIYFGRKVHTYNI